MNDIPRTLLLTWWPASLRFAGGEALRQTLSCLPREQIRWATLCSAGMALPDGIPETRSFSVPRIPWRLRKTVTQHLWEDEVLAGWRARQIATWCREFRPEVLWVLPELQAVRVALKLQSMLKIPVHLTLHDVPENSALSGMSSRYYPRFLSEWRRLCLMASSVDAVSAPLLAYARSQNPDLADNKQCLFPASLSLAVAAQTTQPITVPRSDQVRRIGFCGSMRVSRGQWADFLQALAGLPWQIEIVVVTDQDHFHEASLPENVRVNRHDYFKHSAELVQYLREANLHACYLGLWRESARAVFAETSLSSKLTAYAAVGVPVIVDGPEDSVAWDLVSRCGAGICLAPETFAKQLTELLSDKQQWSRMAQGASRLCRECFVLEENVARFVALLRCTAEA